MRQPTHFKADEIACRSDTRKEIDGIWVMCRPLPLYTWGVRQRLWLTWQVLTGRFDAVEWYKQ